MAIGTVGALVGSAVLGAGASIISGNKAAKAQQKGAQLSADTERYFYDTTRADQAPYREVGSGALYKLADMYGVPRPVFAPANDSAAPSLAQTYGVTGFNPLGGRMGEFTYGPTGEPSKGQPTPQTKMTAGYDGFQQSPGYQFRLNEGIKAAERSAAARGLLGSGATMKGIQRYGEGLAASEYESFANRLAALAGVGQTATNATSAAGQTAANGISNAFTNAGNARASSYANTGAAINNGAQNLASMYLYQQGGGFGGGGQTFPGYGYGGNTGTITSSGTLPMSFGKF